MQRWLIVLLTVLASTTATASAQNTGTSAHAYRLSDRSTYQSGCFPPCLCPILAPAAVRGTFRLTPNGVDGVFNAFTVSDVSWTVSVGTSKLNITGSGTYRIGGEVALQQQLELDLVIDGNAAQHLDSGLVAADSAPFPAINVTVSMNHMFCYDTVIVVDAGPVEPCIGDCNGDGVVTIDEIVTGVAMTFEGVDVDRCLALDCNPSGRGVLVNCLVTAVGNALNGCGQSTPAPEGACCLGDCTTGTTNCTPWTQDACCNYARYSAIALAIWWCPSDQFDPQTNRCTACVEPCLGLPPSPPGQDE
jgi:hypothetical protein